MFVFLFIFVADFFGSPMYELRGVWIASVKNIDWPSKSDLTVEEQKNEIVECLNTIQKLNFNTIFLQIRPASDALYSSVLEPWSVYLTGKSGRAPSPIYDPLEFWIKEAHSRGIDIHAWINPFRASMSIDEELDSCHPVKKHPDWFIVYNNKYQYDAGNPECRKYIADVVKDIVTRYDLDGVHMDDYFYPYPVPGETFNDSTSYFKWCETDLSFKTLEEWRRWNVDQTISLISKAVKETKPYVAFGISPFGVWRNQSKDPLGSATNAGITNYDDLYADILKWMKDGMIDYVVPQIYWDTDHKTANYKILTQWWNDHSYNTPVIIGHGLYRINSHFGLWDDPTQMPQQIKIARQYPFVTGSVFFSYNHLKRDLLGFQDSLIQTLYKYPSLVPELIDSISDPTVFTEISLKKKSRQLNWNSDDSLSTIRKFVVNFYPYNKSQPELLSSSNIMTITGTNFMKLIKQHRKKKQLYWVNVDAYDYYHRFCGRSAPIKIRF